MLDLEEKLTARTCELDRARKRLARLSKPKMTSQVKVNGHVTSDRLSPSIVMGRRLSDGVNSIALVKPLRAHVDAGDATSLNARLDQMPVITVNGVPEDSNDASDEIVTNTSHSDSNDKDTEQDNSLLTPEGGRPKWYLSSEGEASDSDLGISHYDSDTDLSTFED